MSEVPVNVIDEVEIPSVWEYLKSLEKDGELKIYRYPSRPNFYPTDDSDLIEVAISMYLNTGDLEVAFAFLEKYYPELIERDKEVKSYLLSHSEEDVRNKLSFFK